MSTIQKIHQLILSILLLLICVMVASATELAQPFPALIRASSWSVAPGSEGYMTVGEAPSCLVVRFRAVKDANARLLLREPIPIPEDVTGFTFLGATSESQSGLYLHVILRDAKGREFLAYTKSPNSFQKGIFYPEHSWRRVRQVRFTVPGLARPRPEPNAGATMVPPTVGLKPQLPFTLIGLYCQGEHQQPETSFTELYLQGFTLTTLSPSTTQRYYQFNDQECFGEVEPLPTLSLGDLGHWYGRQFAVSWDVRDHYDGQPFLTGGNTYSLDPTRADLPYPLQLAQHIDFPVREEGTYWVRVRLRWWNVPRSAIPDEIRESEYRLYIKKGEKATTHAVASLTTLMAHNLVCIAPDHSLTYAPEEKFMVPVAFRQPDDAVANPSFRVTVRALNSTTVLKSVDVTPVWTGDKPYLTTVDLTDLPVGAYIMTADVLSAGKPVDQVTRVVGKRIDSEKAALMSKIPDNVPSWQQMLAQGTPLFQLSPMVLQDQLKGITTREDMLKTFMDNMGPVSHEMEYQISWSDVEPLPGVYDWREVDHVLDYAQQKGIRVLLWPQMVGSEPEWLPSYYTENKEGAIFGHNAYLFHGARLNFWHQTPVREAAMRLIANLAARYKSHPAVDGYFILTEHPGEAPYAGWYDGYDPATLASFRRYTEDHWKTLTALNQHWGTHYTSWDAIVPPQQDDLPQYWLDWMRCRTGAINQFLMDGVTTIRKYDSKRLIVVYADGAENAEFFRMQGCMLANGGSHDPERGATGYLASALQGLQERTEDHSPGRWTAYFPTQLDASLFGMTMGGGRNTHCKSYMVTGKPFDVLRTPPYSLDRYEQFMPIWTALRRTEPMPIDAFMLDDYSGRLLATRSTYYGGGDVWTNMNSFQAHLICPVGPLTLCEQGKLLLATDTNLESLEESTLTRLAQYVERGGVLVMRADAGRVNIQAPTQPWALLTRFGITPPNGPRIDERYTKAVPIPGDVFAAGASPFVLREIWPSAPQTGMQTLATFDGDPSRVAMSWKPFGKGKVVVIWASTVVPPAYSVSHGGGEAVFRDLARWAGVRLYTDATQPQIWTNLLQDSKAGTYYALAYHSVWQNDSTSPIASTVRFQVPDGEYNVTEMISQRTLGVMNNTQLWTQGLSLTLKPREVAIYQLQKVTKP